jgi:polysaccharide chain length determinant protein (PEP-CTERM system associated)
MAWRRKWIIVIPLVLFAGATAIGSRFLPVTYRSETTILVVPQRVPETYVRSTVTSRIEDRLQSISQQILSRTRLERIIQDFNLYAEQRAAGIMEDVIEVMRRNITVEVVKGDAFRVSYVGSEPRTVMQVTERLATLFIDENLRDRELLAEGTNQFLESQLEEARQRLIEQEQKLAAYQRQYSGELPTQSGANLQVLQNTQMQIQALQESVNRDHDRKLVVERALADLNLPEPQVIVFPAIPQPGDASQPARTLQEQLKIAEETLRALELRLRPEHPDVVRASRAVVELQQRVQAAALDVPLSPVVTPAAPPASELARRNRREELEAELRNIDTQIAEKRAEEQRLREVSANYQARVEVIPLRQAELAELTRDYGTSQNFYNGLLSKKADSEIAANLERRQIGEHFKLLDPARVPERPFSPNLFRINLLGALFGLGLGVAVAALVEYRDTSFKTDVDVTSVLGLPVLATIPVMLNTVERRHHAHVRIAVAIAVVLIVVLSGAGVLAWRLGALDGVPR